MSFSSFHWAGSSIAASFYKVAEALMHVLRERPVNEEFLLAHWRDNPLFYRWFRGEEVIMNPQLKCRIDDGSLMKHYGFILLSNSQTLLRAFVDNNPRLEAMLIQIGAKDAPQPQGRFSIFETYQQRPVSSGRSFTLEMTEEDWNSAKDSPFFDI